MQRRRIAGVALTSMLITAISVSGVSAAPRTGAATTGRYIVVLNDSVNAPAAVAAEHARAQGARISHVYRWALKGYSATLSSNRLAALRADPRVAYLAADRPVHTTGQVLPTGIDRVDAERSSTHSGNGKGRVDVDVAVLDSGIDIDHPDLSVAGGVNCVGGSSFDDDFIHGTHVAGTVAAKDNHVGVVGVAPGARLWAVKVVDQTGTGTIESVMCGVDWVTAHRSTIEVANMSLTGEGAEPPEQGCTTSDPFHDAICRSVQAGVTYAVSAGNDASNAKDFAPASYNEVITVSALADFDGKPGGRTPGRTCLPPRVRDQDDTLADFSNFGRDIDLIAPGVCILSTVPGGGHRRADGTSMASPHAAGAAALYKASHPHASPLRVKRALQRAGSLRWNNADDPDLIKERLVNVDAF
jgi:subtilisin family serine protease